MKLSTLIQSIINNAPFIRESMDAGLINYTSLARYLQPKVQRHFDKKINTSAIVMAIARMPPSPSQSLDKSLRSFMQQLGNVVVRSDIEDFSYAHSSSIQASQSRFLASIDNASQHYYSICMGMNETTIVVSKHLQSQVEAIFIDETLVVHRSNLAALGIKLPKSNQEVSGVYYTLLKQLAWQGINIVEVLSTSNEITLVVSKSDIDQVFAMVMRLKNEVMN